MTQSRENDDRDIFTRMAQVEYRLARIENTNAQLRETIAPGGYLTDAFERLLARIDEFEERLSARMDARFDSQDARFDSQDAKLDIILKVIVGLGNS
jgi:hypothetical protein